MLTVRYVDTAIDRPRWRVNAAVRAMPRLSLGLEWNPVVEEVSPTFNWIAALETERTPIVSVGTSSDRIGTPEGNYAYFATFAKGFGRFAPYVSVNYSQFENGFNFPYGVNVALHPQWDLLHMHDGRRTHLLLTYKQPSYNLSLMLIWLKRPGISVSFGF